MKIAVLGSSGCNTCKDLFERIKKIAEETQSTAIVTKVDDITEI
jgi:thioredoxin-like negative regulator of GroEL